MCNRFKSVAMLALLAPLAACQTNVTDKDIRPARIEDVRTLVQQAQTSPSVLLLIDPRPTDAFDAGHLPGARNLQLPRFDEKRGKDPALEAFRNIVVYGENPASPPAKSVTKRLIALGYKGVRMFMGGLDEWTKAGLELETSDQVNK